MINENRSKNCSSLHGSDAPVNDMVVMREMEKNFLEAMEKLEELNPLTAEMYHSPRRDKFEKRDGKLQKVLVANRGEIAKRFFLALHEEGIPSVAVVTDADRGQSWYEFADEVIYIGENENYTSIWMIIASTVISGGNAIYSGYGFLSENHEFVQNIKIFSSFLGVELIFMGPDHRTMKLMGDKISARNIARENDIPLFESSEALDDSDMEQVKREAERIGYPVIIKLSSGGGGKGMYPVFKESELEEAVASSCRIGRDLYSDSTFYLEKYIQHPVHVEVQIFNGSAIGIRKCAVQRRNQKIIEESGHTFLDDYMALSFLASAEKLAEVSEYCNGSGAGTVEFLIDSDTGKFGFLEMNTRLQVEYAVTDQSLGIDIVKWQILFFDGREGEIENPDNIKYRTDDRDHSIECRIYAEDPENNYLPSPGKIVEMDFPTFNGIRCDFGFAKGDAILPMYDPMIGKLIAHGSDRREALIRLERALQELYIKGIKTNLHQLLRIVRHPEFIKGDYTNNLLEESRELLFDNEGAYSQNDEPVIFGAFCEYLRELHERARDFSIIARLEGVADCQTIASVPSRFIVLYNSKNYRVEYLQVSMDDFVVLINGRERGRISLNSFNDRDDDIVLVYENRSRRIRMEHHSTSYTLKMRDADNKVDYFRMNISPEGQSSSEDMGVIRSPFQGTFVSFGRYGLSKGDNVKAGEALVVLSAMKMETVLEAPIDGTIDYIIEGGNADSLILSRTPDGRIMGKGIQDGEVLIKINGEEKGRNNVKEVIFSGKEDQDDEFTSTIELIVNDFSEDIILKDIEIHFNVILELFLASVRGFIQDRGIINKLVTILELLPQEQWKDLMNAARGEGITDVIFHYTNIRRLFSPVISESGFCFQDELNRYINNRNSSESDQPSEFIELMKELMKAYRLDGENPTGVVDSIKRKHFIFLLKQSHQYCIEFWKRVGSQFHVVGRLLPDKDRTMLTLKRLLLHAQTESDDSSYKRIKNFLAHRYPDSFTEFFSRGWMEVPRNRKISQKPVDDISIISVSAGDASEGDQIPGNLHPLFLERLEKKVKLLENRFSVTRLASPFEDIIIYRLEKPDGEGRYAAFSFVELDNIGDARLLSKTLKRVSALLHAFNGTVNGEENWLEIIVTGKPLMWDYTDGEALGYELLREQCSELLGYYYNGSLSFGIIDADIINPGSVRSTRREVAFTFKNDKSVFDILQEDDGGNIYCTTTGGKEADQQLYDRGKWPVDIWARETFDPGSMEEITIASIDDNVENVKVGARIYTGTIQGGESLFYMKDFRIRGGSTGDLEGRKYVAAAYLAYMRGLPLFVWNDSAGANIKEGVVSLNRGAEGFMMNSFLSGNSNFNKFLQYRNSIPDPLLRSLFCEIDESFSLGHDTVKRRGRSMLVAVGIGASAGLDVYGSSQATIQILLDSENSYRVLTGSNVIRSVMGEKISNYDIGGASVLGKWAGIVDIVACDKIDMIRNIHRIRRFFQPKVQGTVVAKQGAQEKHDYTDSPSVMFQESIVEENVDHGEYWLFRENYYGANSIIAGFASLGGSRVLVMGPRTDNGLVTSAAITKSRELLRMAQRTDSHQLLVFGKKWYRIRGSYENASMRSRMDFIRTVNDRKGVRIHVITDIEGLKAVEINSYADAIIFIKKPGISDLDLSFARKNATFITESFPEAFELARCFIHLLDKKIAGPGKATGNLPSISDNASEPYDIVESVIEHVFDEDSFMEMYNCLNDPVSGPSLVTGLARLKGETVGIIADQPLIKGGGADSAGTEKFRIFMEFLESKGIPLVMLSNSSGFVPGSKEERFRIQAIGAESLDVNVLSTIPVVSVVLNQNYGGRLIHAFNKYLRPGIVYLALEKAVMAVIGSTAAFDLLKGSEYSRFLKEGKQDEADVLYRDFISTFMEKSRADNDAFKSGVIDWIIEDITGLRDHLVKGLTRARERCSEAFGPGNCD